MRPSSKICGHEDRHGAERGPRRRRRADPAVARDGLRRRLHARGQQRRDLPVAARRSGRADRHLHQRRHRVPAQSDASRVRRLRSPTRRQGPVCARHRQPDPSSHRKAIQRSLRQPRRPRVRVGASAARDLPLLSRRRAPRLPGRVLHAHADDTDVHPGSPLVGSAPDLGGCPRPAHDPDGRARSPTECSSTPSTANCSFAR